MRSASRKALLCSLSLVAASYCEAAPSIQWFKSFGAEAAMSSGQPLVAANSDVAYAWLKSPGGTNLHKFDAVGNQLWTRELGDLADFDNYDISVDAVGNAYISWGGTDWHVQKHGPSGDIAWTRTHDVTPADRPYAGTSADNSGNVYVGGGMRGSFHPSQGVWDHDAAIGKLDAAGNVLWKRQWGTADHDTLNSIVVDDLGHVFVSQQWQEVGSFGVPSQTTVSKLTDAGDLLWARQFSGYGSIRGVDDSGNAYVLMRPPGAAANDTDFVKLSTDGDVLWTRDVNAIQGFGGGVDAQGNAYFTSGVGTQLDKYGPGGDFLWTLPITSAALSGITSIDVTDVGNIVVSGRTFSPNGAVLDVWMARVIEQVPEPSATSLLLGGLALAAVSRLRKSSTQIRR